MSRRTRKIGGSGADRGIALTQGKKEKKKKHKLVHILSFNNSHIIIAYLLIMSGRLCSGSTSQGSLRLSQAVLDQRVLLKRDGNDITVRVLPKLPGDADKASSSNQRLQCMYCEKCFQGGVSRALAHLLGTSTQIKACAVISLQDQIDLRADLDKKEANKSVSMESKRLMSACKHADEVENDSKRLKQAPIGQSLENATCETVDTAVLNWVVCSAIEHCSWRGQMRASRAGG